MADTQAYDWALYFDQRTAERLLAHPSHEHYLPLLHAAGAADAGEPVRFFNEDYQSASIAMRSVVWG